VGLLSSGQEADATRNREKGRRLFKSQQIQKRKSASNTIVDAKCAVQ
jgi:hypothetical protein